MDLSFGQTLPTYLSADRDPLYRFHQWQANLRILNIQEVKTVCSAIRAGRR
jgi:putative transposase